MNNIVSLHSGLALAPIAASHTVMSRIGPLECDTNIYSLSNDQALPPIPKCFLFTRQIREIESKDLGSLVLPDQASVSEL